MTRMIRHKQMEVAFDLWEDGKLNYIEPPCAFISAYTPLRVTTSEWIDLCGASDEMGNIYLHYQFTLFSVMKPCFKTHVGYKRSDGTIVDHGAAFDLEISIACPKGRPQRVMYGPYEREDGYRRAIARAGEYLIQNKVLALVDMPEGANPREWIMAYKEPKTYKEPEHDEH